MGPFLLILALSCAQLETPQALLHAGDSIEGTLPLNLEANRNSAKRSFVLELGSAGPCTVRLESADFDPRLVVAATGDLESSRTGGRLAYWDAWLVIEGAPGSRRELSVESEDDHGGSFRLSVVAGIQEPPADFLQSTQSVVGSCSTIAARAEAREEWQRAARFRDTASRAAFAIRATDAARENAELEIRDAERAGANEWELRGRINLGPALREAGELERADSVLAAALPPAREMLAKMDGTPAHGNWVTLVCFLFENLADLRLKVRGPREAVPLYESFAELAANGPRRDIESDAWCKLGFSLDETGETARARRVIERGLAIAEGLSDHTEALASARLSLARHHAKHGRFPESRALCEQALAQAGDPRIRVELLGVLAEALLGSSRYEQARAVMDELETICKADDVHDYDVPIRIHRSTIAFRLGEYTRARALLEETLVIANTPGQIRDRIEVLTNLGLVLDALGEKDLARERLDEALDACERTHDGDRAARILIDLAVLLESEGELSPALAALDHAELLASREEDTRLAAVALVGRAFVLHRQGDFAAAFGAATTAAAFLEGLGERRAVLHAKDTIARIGLVKGELAQVEESLCYAKTFFEEQDEEPLDFFAASAWRSPYADWGCIGQDLAAQKVAVARTPEERRTAIEEGLCEDNRWKARILLERMRTRLGSDRYLDPISPLPEDNSAVIQFTDGLDRLYAYVLVGAEVRFIDLGERDSIERGVRELVEGVALRRLKPSAFAAASAQIASRLLLPVAAAVPPGTKRWTIVPTPALATLPMELLVDPTSVAEADRGGYASLRYLLDGADSVTYGPSSAVLARLRRGRGPRRSKHFLIAGDPIYLPEIEGARSEPPSIASRPGSSLLDYDRLKGTRIESCQVANLLMIDDPKATLDQKNQLLEVVRERSKTIRTDRFDLYLGSSVTTDLLRGDLSGYTNLHIAAHGHVDTTDPRRSGIVLGYDPGTGGLFALEDLLATRLDADLVVLSACDTAIGPIVRGEGVQSLATAVLEAGAWAVVASLWKVDDGDAADLMCEFYGQSLNEGRPADRALRMAKLAFRRSRNARGKSPGMSLGIDALSPANPYYWSSFVYVGPSLN